MHSFGWSTHTRFIWMPASGMTVRYILAVRWRRIEANKLLMLARFASEQIQQKIQWKSTQNRLGDRQALHYLPHVGQFESTTARDCNTARRLTTPRQKVEAILAGAPTNKNRRINGSPEVVLMKVESGYLWRNFLQEHPGWRHLCVSAEAPRLSPNFRLGKKHGPG